MGVGSHGATGPSRALKAETPCLFVLEPGGSTRLRYGVSEVDHVTITFPERYQFGSTASWGGSVPHNAARRISPGDRKVLVGAFKAAKCPGKEPGHPDVLWAGSKGGEELLYDIWKEWQGPTIVLNMGYTAMPGEDLEVPVGVVQYPVLCGRDADMGFGKIDLKLPWTCSACTVDNTAEAQRCPVCGEPGPRRGSPLNELWQIYYKPYLPDLLARSNPGEPVFLTILWNEAHRPDWSRYPGLVEALVDSAAKRVNPFDAVVALNLNVAQLEQDPHGHVTGPIPITGLCDNMITILDRSQIEHLAAR